MGEFQWLADMEFFSDSLAHEALAAAEVPQITVSPTLNVSSYNCRSNKFSVSNKKPRIEISDEDDFFTVPDLG